MTDRELLLQNETALEDAIDARHHFEEQLPTRKALDESSNVLAKLVGHLQGRLEFLALDGTREGNNVTSRLQEDIDSYKQCLEICKRALNEVSRRKVHRISEVIVNGDSDEVVIATLADLFDAKKALSRGRSAQSIGSTTDETYRQLLDTSGRTPSLTCIG